MKIKEIYNKNEKVTVESYLRKCGVKDINEFYNPSGKYIESYTLYNDIIYAVQEVKYLLNYDNSNIIIVQDSDLDGICSTLILYQYLSNLNNNWNIEILIHTGKQRGLDDEDIMNAIRDKNHI